MIIAPSRRRFLRMTTMLGLSTTLTPAASLGRTLEPNSPRFANPSALATRSLLLSAAHAGSRLVAVGIHGHILLSDDRGHNWRQASQVPTWSTLTAVAFANPRIGWAAGHDSTILRTGDGGVTWQLKNKNGQAGPPILSLYARTEDHCFAFGAFGQVWESQDSGETWKLRPLRNSDADNLHLNAAFRGPENAIFLVAEFGTVYRSVDNGESFREIETPFERALWGGLTLPDSSILVFGVNGGVLRSQTSGRGWIRVNSTTSHPLTDGVVLSDGTIVLVGLAGTVVTSSDNGLTFRSVDTGRPLDYATVAEAPDGALLLLGEGGVQRLSWRNPASKTNIKPQPRRRTE